MELAFEVREGGRTMKLPLSLFTTQRPVAATEPGDGQTSRLDKIVARQRRVNTDARLDRLSRQDSDPQDEDAPSPLYGSEAYGGADIDRG